MTKSDLKKQVRELMIENIHKVLSQEIDYVELLYVRPNEFINYIESIGGELEKWEKPNGWEWDYSSIIKFKNVRYEFYGDGYRRSSMSFCIYKD